MDDYRGNLDNDHAEKGSIVPTTQVKTFQWEHYGVEYFYYPGDLFSESSHPKIQITTPFTPSDFRASWQSAGGRNLKHKLEEEASCLVVSDQPHALSWNNYGEFTSFYLTPEYLYYCAHDLIKGEKIELAESFNKDPLLWQLSLTLRQELRQPKVAPSRLLIESLVNVVAAHLVQNYRVGLGQPLYRASSLSQAMLKQLMDYIEAHLKEDLSLVELGQLVCISPFHLSRSFKKATGRNIHQYILTRRIEKAKVLLATTTLPLSDIGFQSGFNSQSYFTTQFRQSVGIPPKAFRMNRA